MFDIGEINTQDKKEFYKQINTYLVCLIDEEADWLADISNGAALLYMMMPDINWVGFYLYKEGELVLGSFQGKPACVRIALGKGVCGTAANTKKVQVVEDVSEFPGHIACDIASKSEVVLPIIKNDRLIGVLDIDSPIKTRFNSEDAQGLSEFVNVLNRYIDWPEQFY